MEAAPPTPEAERSGDEDDNLDTKEHPLLFEPFTPQEWTVLKPPAESVSESDCHCHSTRESPLFVLNLLSFPPRGVFNSFKTIVTPEGRTRFPEQLLGATGPW